MLTIHVAFTNAHCNQILSIENSTTPLVQAKVYVWSKIILVNHATSHLEIK